MKKNLLSLLLAVAMISTATAEWKIAGDKIRTQWAETIDPQNVLPEYPRPQLERELWLNLNGLWNYAITPFNTAKPSTFEGQILVPFAIESALSGVQKTLKPTDILWYERTFTVPAKWASQSVMLNFGAVDWSADVYVNDILVGSHTGGFTPFACDITSALNKKGAQKLVVRVWDRHPLFLLEQQIGRAHIRNPPA